MSTDKRRSSSWGPTEPTTMLSSKRIRNTFAPMCKAEDFDCEDILHMCRNGFPYERLPEEAKVMMKEMKLIHDNRCKRYKDVVLPKIVESSKRNPGPVSPDENPSIPTGVFDGAPTRTPPSRSTP